MNNQEENVNVQEEQSGISLREIFFLFRKNLLLIIIVTFICTACGFGYARFIRKPTYTANATFVVQPDTIATDVSSEYQSYQYGGYLVDSVVSFVVSDPVMEKVAENLLIEDGEAEPSETKILALADKIKKNTSVSSGQSSLIVTVSYNLTSEFDTDDENSDRAAKICNMIVSASKEIADQKKLDEEGHVLKDDNGKDMYRFYIYANKIESFSRAKDSKKSTKTLTITAIGCIIGIVLSCGFALIRYLVDDTYSSKDELERVTGAPVLTYIEGFDRKENK